MIIETIKQQRNLFSENFLDDFENYGEKLEIAGGWYAIVDRFILDLHTYLLKHELSGCKVVQIKQKMGGLRIYMFYDNVAQQHIDMIEAMIAKARLEAAKTCEFCGTTDGVSLRSDDGYLTTSCLECLKKS